MQNEQSVLGALLIQSDRMDDIDLVRDDFLSQAHQDIFSAICKLHHKGKPVDVITVAEILDIDGKLDYVGGLKYLGVLQSDTPSAANIKVYANIVKNNSILRSLKAISADIHSKAELKVNPSDIAEEAETKIFELMLKRDTREPVLLSDALEEAILHVEQRYSGAAIAIPTGLIDLDDALGGGFHKGSLNILAARPKMGKTSAACTMALTASKSGGVIYFASLEMPRREIANRLIAISSGHSTDSIMHDSVAMDSVSISLENLKKLKIIIDDEAGLTVGKLRSRAKKTQRKYGLNMIVVDYLQLMRGDGSNREQEVAGISRGLKGLAKELDLPILCLAQLNRDCESRMDKRPFMSDLRESGAIEQDADLVMMIYRDEVYNKDTEMKGIAEILIRANRHGACADVFCGFDGRITRFNNLSSHWQKPQPQQRKGRGL